MTEKNATFLYTLGEARSHVYRALDEYSSNGVLHTVSEGALADIDNRFTAALNRMIRRIYLSTVRVPLRMTVGFFAPKRLLSKPAFSLSVGENGVFFPPEEAGSLAFSYHGSGKLTIALKSGGEETYPLSTEYGRYETFRCRVPSGALSLSFSTEATLTVRNFYLYDRTGLPAEGDEELLPDGEKLYCRISPYCAELCSVKRRDDRRPDAIPLACFSFENGILSCDEALCGEYEVEYFAYPEPIAEDAEDDTPIPLSPSASDALIYATAAELCNREDGETYSRLLYKYRELLANTYPAAHTYRKNRFYAKSRPVVTSGGHTFRG